MSTGVVPSEMTRRPDADMGALIHWPGFSQANESARP
jgi:hypothetical protein